MDVFATDGRICMDKIVNAVIGGVGMLLGLCVLKSLKSILKIQPRMIVATLNVNPSTRIIFWYSPTNANDEMDFETFYK